MEPNADETTAYHEAGHAVVQFLNKDADPIHKVTIIPRGNFGGATMALPEKDRSNYSKRWCVATMKVCFGGRIAEEMFCGDVNTGAFSDLPSKSHNAISTPDHVCGACSRSMLL